MALIRLGALVTQISGKLGGQTLGTGPAGSYIKNSGTPRKSITLLQQSKMQRMATSAQSWRSLTPGQRSTFISASSSYPYLNRVGETKYYSGYAIYCKLRNNKLNVGTSGLPVPLPLFTFPPLSGAAIVQVGTAFTVSSAGDDIEATYRLFTSRPASKGISNSYKNQFFISNVTAEQLNAGYNVGPNLLAKFGALNAGTLFYWRLDGIEFSSGQVLKNMASGSLLIA